MRLVTEWEEKVWEPGLGLCRGVQDPYSPDRSFDTRKDRKPQEVEYDTSRIRLLSLGEGFSRGIASNGPAQSSAPSKCQRRWKGLFALILEGYAHSKQAAQDLS